MSTYQFHLVSDRSGIVSDSELFELSDKLYEAGCDDGAVMTYNGTVYLSFDREAESYEEAVLSAIKNVESVGGLKIVSVDAGDWVGLTDAAELAGVTKATLSRYSKGNRGAGKFPSPVQRIESKVPLWSWEDIAVWLELHGKITAELVANARTTANINLSLQLRNKDKQEQVNSLLNKLVA